MAKYGTDIKTPIGDLAWVDITDGASYLNSAVKFKATLELLTDSPECKELIAAIRHEWKENKAQGAKNPKLPFRTKRLKTDEEDENGDPVYEDTEYTQFSSTTRKFNAKGEIQAVAVFNAKGAKVSLGAQQIGNGSRGLLLGTLKVYTIYDDKTKAVANCGVSLYLKGIQLAKFKPYAASQVEAPSALAEAEGDFEGIEPELVEEPTSGKPEPALPADDGHGSAPTVDL